MNKISAVISPVAIVLLMCGCMPRTPDVFGEVPLLMGPGEPPHVRLMDQARTAYDVEINTGVSFHCIVSPDVAKRYKLVAYDIADSRARSADGHSERYTIGKGRLVLYLSLTKTIVIANPFIIDSLPGDTIIIGSDFLAQKKILVDYPQAKLVFPK